MEDLILSKLTQGEHIIRYRLACGDNPQGTGPNWGKETMGSCFINRRQAAIRRGNRLYPVGQLILLFLKDGWAEYDESSYLGNGIFEAESYWLQIMEVE